MKSFVEIISNVECCLYIKKCIKKKNLEFKIDFRSKNKPKILSSQINIYNSMYLGQSAA